MQSVLLEELLLSKSEEEMNSKNLIIEKEVSSVICCLRNCTESLIADIILLQATGNCFFFTKQ